MADSVRESQANQDSSKASLQNQQYNEIKALRDRHRSEVMKEQMHHEELMQNMDKSFEVQLTTTKKLNEEELKQIQESHIKQLQELKAAESKELQEEQVRHKAQLEIYKKNSAETLKAAEAETIEAAKKIDQLKNQKKEQAKGGKA